MNLSAGINFKMLLPFIVGFWRGDKVKQTESGAGWDGWDGGAGVKAERNTNTKNKVK